MLPRCMNSFRWSCKLILLSLILIFGISERALAQYFPIHATVQWPSPQSPYLADYSTAGRDRLIVTLLNRDQQQPLLLAKLRLQLKSGGFTAKNREEVVYPMLELNTGVPIRLTSIDLAPYLQPQNLQTTGNLRNGQLPTGYAELSVQVVDYYTARPLSDWHTARTYLDVKKPPILNLPEQDAQVALRDPLFIRFQWTPRHQGLSGTEYEFVLKELPDNGVAPQSAFAYGQEIYRTHTRSTSLSYTHLDPLLLPNRRYAWQVRALSREGVAEFGMFEHGGYSEISWFTLNNQCDAPRGLKAQPRFAKVDLSWSKVLGTTGYIVECRPKTKLNVYEWSQTEVAGDQLTLSQLKPGWTYEWRVGTRCTGNRPVFSEVREFTLSKYNETLLADCGKEPVRPDLAQDPHLGIRAGDIVTIGGDYPMSITEVSPLGDGWYAGKGKTRLKSIIDAPIALHFDRLRINVDKYQIDGTVEASYDETKAKIVNLDYIDDGGKDIKPATIRMREHKMNFTLPDIPQLIYNPKIGELETTDAEGNPQTIKIDVPENASYESIFPMLVTDNKGNTYQISPSERNSEGTGNDVENKNKGEKIELNCERVDRVGDFNTESLSSKYGYIHFKRGDGKYAFDEGQENWYKKSVKVDRFYKPFSKGYIAPWKLVPVGENDIVMAKYDGLKNIDLKKVRFVSEPNSTALPARLNETEQTWTITLRSVSAGASYDIFAVYEGVVIGKLCVVSYSKQKHKLTLVPINDAKLDKTYIERELNAVYAPIGIHFNVEVDERMRGNYSWEVLGEQDKLLSLVGKSFWGYDKELKESTEMLNLQKTYQQAAGTLDGVYLFVLNGATGLEGQKGDLLGEMPRKSRFGYIFAGNSPNTEEIIHTIAHELGHGIFTLQHTFDAEYGKGTRGKTNNLLDYPSNPLDYKEKTELAAFQWNIMASPAIFTALDKKKEGQLNQKTKRVKISNEASERLAKKPVFAPNGRLFLLPKGATIYSIACGDASREQVPLGAVITFTWREEVYSSIYSPNREDFVLYRNDRGEPFVPEWIESGTLSELRFDYDKCLLFIDGESFPIDCSSCAQSRFQINSSAIEISKATEGLLRYAIDLRHKEGKTIEDNQLSSNKKVISLLKAEVVKALSKTPNQKHLNSSLQDKLQAYEQINGRRFVVVTCSIPYVSKSVEEWSALASRVFNESGLGDKDILITIPYMTLPGLVHGAGSTFYMPGVAQGTQAVIAPLSGRFDNSKYQADRNQAGMEDFILEVFRQTRKKLTLYKGYFSASRSITVVADHKGGKELSGYPYNRAIIPYIQKGSDQLINVVQTYQTRESIRLSTLGATDGKITAQGYGHDENQKWLEQNYWPVFFKLAEYADQFDQYEPYTVSDPIHYREGFLDADNGKGLKNYEAYLLQYAYEDVLKKLNLNLRSGFYFKQEHALTDKTDWFLTRHVDEPVYAVLDGASIGLAFVGFDAVPDALNVFYSTIRGNYSNASFASISLILPGSISSKPVKIAWEYTDKHLFRLIRDHAKVSVEPISREVIERGSKQLARGATNEALERLLKSDTRGALRGISHSNIIDAQELLVRSEHPKLAQQVDALRVVVDIRNHRNFKAFGLTDELLGRIASTINTDGYAQIVSNLRVLINKFDPNKIKGLELLVNNLGHTESSFREGAEWTLRYLANNADEFTGASKISFEVLEILPNGRKRIADMVVEYPQRSKVYYEFKSVKNLPPKDFIQQFSNDLTRPNFNIDNLRWVIDGKKIQSKDLEKLLPDIQMLLSKQAPRMSKRQKDALVKKILKEVFVIN